MLSRNEMIGPWAGLPVAWKEDFSFDEEVYRENVEKTCRAGVPGVYTGGTTGEFYAMDFEEFKAVSKATVEECKRCGTPVMIGVTSTYTIGAQRRAAYAAELGADAVQLAPPFWMKLTDDELMRFIKETVSACPEQVVTLYETPRSKNCLTVQQHRAVFDAVPAYKAVKSNAGSVGSTPEGCSTLSEFVNVWVHEGLWSKLGPYGAIGCASSLVYMNPGLVLGWWDLLKRIKWDELRTWTNRLELHEKEGLAPFRARGFSDSAYDHLQGLAAGFLTMNPRSRGPYTSATDEDVIRLRTWLQKNLPEFLEL